MALFTLSLTDRYIAAFGQAAVSRLLPKAVTVENDYGLSFYDAPTGDFEHVRFKADNTQVKFASIPFTGETDKSVLAPPPLLFFEQSKNLIETPVNGTDHVVVERWGTNPWNIRIKGILVDTQNRTYPSSKIKELYRFFKYNGVVDSFGTQFIDKSIKSLYFKRISVQGVEGFPDTIQFLLEARSISPVGFSLLNLNS